MHGRLNLRPQGDLCEDGLRHRSWTAPTNAATNGIEVELIPDDLCSWTKPLTLCGGFALAACGS